MQSKSRLPAPKGSSVLAAVCFVVCCGLSGLARADDTVPCRNGTFPAQNGVFALAKVVGAPRTYLRSDLSPCPDDSIACRGRAYVVPGDTVLTGAVNGPYVCAFFPTRNGGSAGYVRQEEIAAQPVASTVPLDAWTGEWWNGDNSIALSDNGTGLAASGHAYWPSANPSSRDWPGGPHIGDMSGAAAPRGNTVVFGSQDDPTDCRVTLTLLPPFLLAVDNTNCGGANVTFNGVYRQR
jgi:hypothetical protein